MLSTVLLALAIAPTASGSYVIIPQQVEHNGITYEVTTQNSKLIAIPLNQVKKEVKPQMKSTPQPIPQEAPIDSDYFSQIKYWCSFYGCNPNTLHRVMMCESGGNPRAYNRSGATGIFQFLNSTFRSYAPKAGITSPDLWNPKHQIQTAAFMFSTGQAKQWSCK